MEATGSREIRLVKHWKGTRGVEKALQNHLAKHRIGGEIFRNSDEVLSMCDEFMAQRPK
jgi:hypothetical protein